MTFFSVIITNYNCEKFIYESINSVINQTFVNFELIIVDNHSTDKSLKIIKSFNDPRIKIFLISNLGVIAKSRNYGIKLAKGKWIAFLDSDDYWLSDKLQEVFECIRLKKKNQVFCHNEKVNYIKNNKYFNSNYGPYTKNFYENLILNGNKISLSASIVNRDFLIKKQILFRENKKFITAEDYDFWLNLSLNNAKFFFMKKQLGVYNIHQNSMSSNIPRHHNNVLNVLKDHIFNVQNFSKNKNKLFNYVKFRVKKNQIINKFNSNQNFLRLVIDLLILLINYPLLTTKYLIRIDVIFKVIKK